MHLRKKSVPSGKGNRSYYSICQTTWDSDKKRPKERMLIYLGKNPIIFEDQIREKKIPIKELEALVKKTDLQIAMRTDRLPDRLKRIIDMTKKQIPLSVWQDFKRLGFHLHFKMSKKSTGLADAPRKTEFRPFVDSAKNKLIIRLAPELALYDDEISIQCSIAEEIAHQYACAKTLRGEYIPPQSVIEEEVWVLLMLKQWGFPEEWISHFASTKNWLEYATRKWGNIENIYSDPKPRIGHP